MENPKSVAVIVGSLRRASWNRKIALSCIGLASAGMKLEIVEIGDLGLYNADLEEDTPAEWVAFRGRIQASDAVLFVTPEYNRSVPGVLKNAVDIGSRPSGKSSWAGKPGAVISGTPGALGAMCGNHQLRQALTGCGVLTMSWPEVYIGGVASLFDDNGSLVNEGTRGVLGKFLTAFEAWIETTRGA